MVTIRPATTHDVPAIRAVARRSWRAAHAPLLGGDRGESFFESEYDRRTIQKKVVADRSRFIVAVTMTGVAGFAVVAPVNDAADVYGLSWLYVDPDHWRRGIGTRLLARIKRAVQRQNGRRIRLGVLAGNQRAIDFYERMGFWRHSTYFDDRIDARGYIYVTDVP
ncbi:GNAT family N-acetyltransferase [Halocatena halophila]|uniref:GNAT family N-acetyltransferase n=1 Tax=Halocatena halophila TaxID=2814576 RepID=UPI002ED535C8